MSSICGMIHLDGTPVDPDALRKMAEAASYSGPDGTRYWIGQNAGFAHLALHATPEAKFEQQPVRDPHNGLLWVADARVDNREELIDLFKKNGDISAEAVVTDVDLLMLAYRHWGDDFLPKIYGNYAFVMWDPARQRLLAGRDFLGLRPMFYARQGQTLYFASVLRSILAVLPERPPLNEGLIADYYRYNFDRWVAETIYLPIRRLPAACMLIADEQHEELRQHWMITNAPILRYKNDQEYYDRFLELFELALKACARTAEPLGIYLSGGVDSSAITCTLHKMWMENRLDTAAPAIKLCYMHYKSGPREDELQFHEAVVEACPRFSSTILSGEKIWGLQEIGNEQGYHLDEPEPDVMRSAQTTLFQQLRQEGCRVALQGVGGDELFQIPYDDLHLLRDVPVPYWFKAARGYFYLLFLRMMKLTPGALLQKIGLRIPLFRRRHHSHPWLRAEWLQKTADRSRIFRLAVPDEFSSVLQRIQQTALFIRGYYLALLEYNQHLAVENGIEVRYPFLDRRLIEFVFRLPTEKLADSKLVLKPFLKAALSGILPEQILRRRSKSVLNTTIEIGLYGKERPKIEKLLAGVQNCQSRYINFPVYNKYWDDFLAEKKSPRRALLVPLMLQAWMEDYSSVQETV